MSTYMPCFTARSVGGELSSMIVGEPLGRSWEDDASPCLHSAVSASPVVSGRSPFFTAPRRVTHQTRGRVQNSFAMYICRDGEPIAGPEARRTLPLVEQCASSARHIVNTLRCGDSTVAYLLLHQSLLCQRATNSTPRDTARRLFRRRKFLLHACKPMAMLVCPLCERKHEQPRSLAWQRM